MNVILQSLGAAETVTGSKHLLKTPELNILVDCGLFQGIKSLREQNWQPLDVDASKIDLIILTHAHLDHCGYIPLIVKKGFKGKIYMSRPTAALAKLILLDSAKLQEEDAENANRHHYTKHHPAKPLYTIADAEASFRYFTEVEENVPLQLSQHISFVFRLCGHILGACSALITCYGKKILFSGDIGRTHSAILPAPDFFTAADYVIMESTYGDRLHGNEDSSLELERWINHTINNGGHVIIPSFAVGRAQELIYILTMLKKEHRIPMDLPIIMDSPMAASATEIAVNFSDQYLTTSKTDWLEMVRHIKINKEFSNTRRLVNDKQPKIVIAASGMLSGGRVLEYLKHYLGDENNTILMIGFQAEGTRGRALLNGAHELKIHGKFYPVKAKTIEIFGLSAHADQAELITWVKKLVPIPVQVMLVHGEPCAQEMLRVKLQDELHIPVKIMKQNQDVILFVCQNENDQFNLMEPLVSKD